MSYGHHLVHVTDDKILEAFTDLCSTVCTISAQISAQFFFQKRGSWNFGSGRDLEIARLSSSSKRLASAARVPGQRNRLLIRINP